MTTVYHTLASSTRLPGIQSCDLKYLVEGLGQHLPHKLKDGEMVLMDLTGRGGVEVAFAVGLQGQHTQTRETSGTGGGREVSDLYPTHYQPSPCQSCVVGWWAGGLVESRERTPAHLEEVEGGVKGQFDCLLQKLLEHASFVDTRLVQALRVWSHTNAPL